jgi:Fic family protein
VGLIKETHKILTTGTYDEQRFIKNREAPGDFKKHDSVIGINEVGVAADNVEKEILDLISKLNNYNKEDTLKAGSYFHAKFEYIHPFADGNGRVGRTLLNYYLLTHNHPPLIIFNDDKNLYYECLNKYDETEDINSLYSFLIHQTEKTWEKTYLNFKNH